jgi:hypothetical protein
MTVVNQYAQIGNPKFTVQKAVFLCSEAGCLLQAEHTDGTPTTGVFCSCVLAIQDGTKIMMNGETIYLNVGEAIFFHPDVFHRGCDYVKANNRLFFYIAEEKSDIPTDGVGDLEPRYCKYCNEFYCMKVNMIIKKKGPILTTITIAVQLKTRKKNWMLIQQKTRHQRENVVQQQK